MPTRTGTLGGSGPRNVARESRGDAIAAPRAQLSLPNGSSGAAKAEDGDPCQLPGCTSNGLELPAHSAPLQAASQMG